MQSETDWQEDGRHGDFRFELETERLNIERRRLDLHDKARRSYERNRLLVGGFLAALIAFLNPCVILLVCKPEDGDITILVGSSTSITVASIGGLIAIARGFWNRKGESAPAASKSRGS